MKTISDKFLLILCFPLCFPFILYGASKTSYVERNHVHKIHNATEGRLRITVNTNGNEWGWYPQIEELEPNEKKEINVYAWCTTGFEVEGLGGVIEEKKAKYPFKKDQCASYEVTIIYAPTRLRSEKTLQINLKKIAQHT